MTLFNPYKSLIRNIKDFPKSGIIFRDITPLLRDSLAFNALINELRTHYIKSNIKYIVGIESRGFIIGSALAASLGVGFIPIRKKGKLPYRTINESYDLEYGKDVLEIHTDSINEDDRVLIVDDLLATGGTALAAYNLIERLKGNVIGFCCVIELSELNGRAVLERRNCSVHSVIKY